MIFLNSLRPSEQLRICSLLFLVGLFFPLSQWREGFLISGVLCIAAGVWKRFWIVPLVICLFAMAWSGWREVFDFRGDFLVFQTGEIVELEGTVRSAPDIREDSVRAFVHTHQGNFLLVLPPSQSPHYGDLVHVKGKLTAPKESSDFDYLRYLRRWGVQTILKNPKTFEIRASQQGNIFVHRAQKLRRFFETNLRRGLSEPHATIASGILLGVKSALPAWTQQDFKNSGLQHLLVVSGSNVALVLALVAILLSQFGRIAVFVGSLLALAFFVLLVGPDAPVLRAAVMGGVGGIALALGRFSDARTLVLVSAVLLGILEPALIRDDVGFHLSFMATLGIVLGTPVFVRYFMHKTQKTYVKSILLVLTVSLSAQIAVLPVLGNSFGVFPLAGVLANVLAEPLIPFAMAFSSVVAFLGWFPIFVVRVFAIPAFVCLDLLVWVAHVFGLFPVLPVNTWSVWISAVGVGGFFLWGLFSRSFAEQYLTHKNMG